MSFLNAYRRGREGRSSIGQGYSGSLEHLWHNEGARDRARAARDATPSQSDGGIFLLLLMLPPLVAPGLLLVWLWFALAAKGWNTWACAGACFGAMLALGWIVRAFFRVMPSLIAAIMTAGYMGACYGLAARWGDLEQGWTAGIAAVAAFYGLAYGRRLSRRHRG